ncbi:ABC transporter ATP-binding protein [Saccharopolyspora sp. HNM0983]|uniref:ABC transporter ATP-binding protein n=2 Tax=Saccharopolyspora montiporae TaxID=2781240 RepID=A0A929B7Y1_9PSEU|nr:ABC transporter ATP-binding protein [Saccharopolyspora sp. HNM0983]
MSEPPGASPALVLDGLTKSFRDTRAVDDAHLTVPPGSFFGLVGPNGAGKTTALSMAVGLLRPDSGHARVFGADVWTDPVAAKQALGVLPDGLSLPERLTGRELLTYLGRLRGLDAATIDQRSAELLTVLDLDDAGRTLVVDYSAGMRKKIGLAAALLHAPSLLVLDEPFEAVDPVSATTIRTILQRFAAGGGAVVLSSHVMTVVEQLCDHVGVMSAGRVVAQGTLDDVRGQTTLDDAFVRLVGARTGGSEGLSWLASSSD